MNQFVWGANAALSLIAALFFLKFWRASHDRLFLIFTIAFGVFAFHWMWLAWAAPPNESAHYVYGVRLLAFAMIVTGVLDKNRRSPKERSSFDSRRES